MPLTLRNNGSAATNIIQASWFNDFYNLLTGTMQDQEVGIKNNLVLSSIGAAPTTAPTTAVASGGTALGVGTYTYAYTFVSPDGESVPSPTATATTTSTNKTVNLSAITAGPTGTTARNVYRSAVGWTAVQLVGTINDNTTTTFTDSTVADGSLGAYAPTSSSFGGSLVLKDSTGAIAGRVFNNGQLYTNGASVVINGSRGGSITFSTPIWGPGLKLLMVTLANFNSISLNYTFPGGLGRGIFFAGDFNGSSTPSFYWLFNGAVSNATILTTGLSNGSTAGSSTAALTSFHGGAFGTITATINGMGTNDTNGLVVNSAIFLMGI